jgi:hypothetical protein
LVICGLLLVVFVRPPLRRLADGGVHYGDWRPIALIHGLLAALLLFAQTGLASYFYELADYAILGAVVAAWACTLWLALRARPLFRLQDWLGQRN